MNIEHLSEDDFSAIEAELFASIVKFPEMRTTLRRDVIKVAGNAYHRSRLYHRLQLSAAISLACVLCVVLGGFYRSLWNPDSSTNAALDGHGQHSEQRDRPIEANCTNATLAGHGLPANALTSEWAMVDAFGEIQSQRAKKLHRVFSEWSIGD